MNICVLGSGYVGLVSAACLADLGHTVSCLDVDERKVEKINCGIVPMHEEGLHDLLARNVGRRLFATIDYETALANAEVVFVCVGTPFRDNAIDLQYVIAAGEELGKVLRRHGRYMVLAVKSTVLPGTTVGAFKEAVERTSGKIASRDFGLGMNPEFLAEGTAVRDFMNPDRIVIGGFDQRSTDILSAVYEQFDRDRVYVTTPSTAEMIKYASNSLLATLISLSNEIASLCDLVPGVDVADVLGGVHKMQHLTFEDSVGKRGQVSVTNFLWAGCGFGGSCFPKDLKALAGYASSRDAPAQLLTAVLKINEGQPHKMFEIMKRRKDLAAVQRVTVLGLAFKPGTDDVRESPALTLIKKLVDSGLGVCAHDPIANNNARQALTDMGVELGRVQFTSDLNSALSYGDVIMLVTSWRDYSTVPQRLCAMPIRPLLIDGRRMWSPESYPRYAGIGYEGTSRHSDCRPIEQGLGP